MRNSFRVAYGLIGCCLFDAYDFPYLVCNINLGGKHKNIFHLSILLDFHERNNMKQIIYCLLLLVIFMGCVTTRDASRSLSEEELMQLYRDGIIVITKPSPKKSNKHIHPSGSTAEPKSTILRAG